MNNRIHYFGTRGSMPVNGPKYKCYGGNTSSYGIEMEGTSLIVDLGFGLSTAEDFIRSMDEVHILLTHPHFDHIVSVFYLKDLIGQKPVHVYGSTFNGRTVKEQFDGLMGEPYWPVTADQDLNITYHTVDGKPFMIGNLRITSMYNGHPGGCTLYRIDGREHSAVIAVDFDHRNDAEAELIEFARNTDLLVYDAMFSDDEYFAYTEWGHSTYAHAIKVMRASNAARLAISQHHPSKTDEELDLAEHFVRGVCDEAYFAYDGLKAEIGKDSPIPEYCYLSRVDADMTKLQKLADSCLKLTSEKDREELYEDVVTAAMEMTNADGGTLYRNEGNELSFKLLINKSMGIHHGGKHDPIDLPPVKMELTNIAAACAILRQTINVADVYENDVYDFHGPRKYDEMTGYHTKSVMVVPLVDLKNNCIGVLQLVNAKDEKGNVVAFRKDDELLVKAIGSQAAITVTNANYLESIQKLLYGFVRSVTKGLEARTPFNAHHTTNMVRFGRNFLAYEERINGPYRLVGDEREALILSIWLHDIGKITTPLAVMDKSDRLGTEYGKDVNNRYGRMELLNELAYARNEIDQETYETEKARIHEESVFLSKINHAGYLTDENMAKVIAIAGGTYIESDGTEYRRLTDEELQNLLIRKGTLTTEERLMMQNHVVMTQNMLAEMEFPEEFKHVPEWAGNHHEFLNGTGYPNGLTDKDLSWQGRLITVLDVFEALTASDRPYRNAMSIERAFAILDEMVNDGQIDRDLVEEYKRSEAWKGFNPSAAE